MSIIVYVNFSIYTVIFFYFYCLLHVNTKHFFHDFADILKIYLYFCSHLFWFFFLKSRLQGHPVKWTDDLHPSAARKRILRIFGTAWLNDWQIGLEIPWLLVWETSWVLFRGHPLLPWANVSFSLCVPLFGRRKLNWEWIKQVARFYRNQAKNKWV